MIEFPENDYDALEIIEKFNDLKSGFKKPTELELATFEMQNYQVYPIFRLLDQPKTNFLTRLSIRDLSRSC